MRVAINAHLLSFSESYRQAGLSRHIYELLRNLPQAAPDLELTAFVGNSEIPHDFRRRLSPRVTLRQSRLPTGRAPVRIAWEQAALPVATARAKVDLLHCPVNVRPAVTPAPVVVTLHDLIFLIYPERFRPAKRFYLATMTGWSARHASQVIAVSEATRQDALRLLGVSPQRITTVHNAVGEQFHSLPEEEKEQFRRQKGLGGRTVLYLGTLEPRKNIPTLLRAFKEVAEQPGFEDVMLIVGGSKGWYYDEIFGTAERLGLSGSGRVRFIGRVPDEELPLWYNSAHAFAYPSLYEGFGLPPVEAMACGVPVLVSDTPSLREVVSAAGICLPAEEVGAWAEALKRVLSDPELASDLSRRGRQQAGQFSWSKTAQGTVEVYRSILKSRNRKKRGRRS